MEMGTTRLRYLTLFLPFLLGGCPAIGPGLAAAEAVYIGVNAYTQPVDTVITAACKVYNTQRLTVNARIASGTVAPPVANKVSWAVLWGDAACANPPGGSPLATAVWLLGIGAQIMIDTKEGQSVVPFTMAPVPY